MRISPHLLASASAALALAACSPSEDAAEDGTDNDAASAAAEYASLLVADGHAIAESNCATCHAIGLTDDSPNTTAPPLREVLALYDAEALTEDFIEGVRINHSEMPTFDFTPEGADALIAYLRSIQVSDEG